MGSGMTGAKRGDSILLGAKLALVKRKRKKTLLRLRIITLLSTHHTRSGPDRSWFTIAD